VKSILACVGVVLLVAVGVMLILPIPFESIFLVMCGFVGGLIAPKFWSK
jgi:hypothetical protein